MLSRTPSIWTRVVGAGLAAGAAAWGSLRWLGGGLRVTGPVAKGVTATTAAVVGTAVFTVSFGDKATGLAPYGKRVAQAVSAGDKAEAGRIIDGVAAEMDARLKSLPPVNSAAPARAATPGRPRDAAAIDPARQLWERARRNRRAVELLRTNVRHAAGQLTKEQWVRAYEDALTQPPADAGPLMDALIAMEGQRTLPADGVRRLLTDAALPAPERARLASWLAGQLRAGEGPLSPDACDAFGALFEGAHDNDAADDVVAAYVERMRRSGAGGAGAGAAAAAVLRDAARLYPDSELGIAAARAWLAGPGDARRKGMVATLVEEHPGTKLAAAFRDEYVVDAIDARRFDLALRALDDGSTARTKTPAEAATATAALAERACDLYRRVPVTPPTPPTPQAPVRMRPAGSDMSAAASSVPARTAPTPLDLCAAVAERALDSGQATFAAELLFASLRNAKALPPDVTTGFAVQTTSDLADCTEGDAAASVAQYLLAAAELKSGRAAPARARLDTLLSSQLPAGLRAGIGARSAQLALVRKDFDKAARLLQEAERAAPDGPLLARLAADLSTARADASLRDRVEAQIAGQVKLIDGAGSAAEAALASRRLADLYLARGDVAQAAGTCVRFAARWPDHAQAPAMLARAFHLLDDAGEPPDGPRLVSIEALLTSRYPNSPEAAGVKAAGPTTRGSVQS